MEWTEVNNKLEKEFILKSFSDIIQRLNDLSKIADEMNHHPDFKVYDYKKISFWLTTHDEGKVTELDYALAQKIDGLFS